MYHCSADKLPAGNNHSKKRNILPHCLGKTFKLTVELGSQCFVMAQNQGGFIDIGDHIGNGKCFPDPVTPNKVCAGTP